MPSMSLIFFRRDVSVMKLFGNGAIFVSSLIEFFGIPNSELEINCDHIDLKIMLINILALFKPYGDLCLTYNYVSLSISLTNTFFISVVFGLQNLF